MFSVISMSVFFIYVFITAHHIFLLFFTLSVSADIKWAILHPEACMSPAAAQCLQKGRLRKRGRGV